MRIFIQRESPFLYFFRLRHLTVYC